MNFCPSCGVDLRKLQEAIDKEKEIWRPTEFGLNSSTEMIDSGSTTIYNPEIPDTFTVVI